MEIHIMSIGTNIQHAHTALRKKSVDKAYFIVGKPSKDEKRPEFLSKYEKCKENAISLKKHIQESGGEVEIVEVRVFDEDSLTELNNAYREIIEKEQGNDIQINITGGTNLMGAVALSSAYFYGASAYYVLDPKDKNTNLIVTLPVPKITYTDSLTSMQKIVLKLIEKVGKLESMSDLIDKKKFQSVQAVKPHVDALEKMKLIEIDKEAKQYKIQLSESGKIIAKMIK